MQRAGALAAAVLGESGAGYCFSTGAVAERGEHIAVVLARCADRCVPTHSPDGPDNERRPVPEQPLAPPVLAENSIGFESEEMR
jgi:hypothetical protein